MATFDVGDKVVYMRQAGERTGTVIARSTEHEGEFYNYRLEYKDGHRPMHQWVILEKLRKA